MRTGLQKQVVPVSFERGINTKVDDKQLAPGELKHLQNAVFTEIKKIQKRPGTELLSSAIDATNEHLQDLTAIMTYKKELITVSPAELFSRSAALDRWVNKGSLVSLDLAARSVISNTYNQSSPASAIHPSGIQVFAWEDSRGTVRYSIVDRATNQLIVSDMELAANSSRPQCASIGEFIIIVYVETFSDDINFRAVPVFNPTQVTAPQTVSSIVSVTEPNYDVCLVGDRCFVAVNTSATPEKIDIVYIDSLLSVSAIVSIADEEATRAIALLPDEESQRVWVVWADGTEVQYEIYDYDLNQVLATSAVVTNADIVNITGVVRGDTATIFLQQEASEPYDHLVLRVSADNLGTASTADVIVRSVGLATKAFVYKDQAYFGAAHESDLQPTGFVLSEFGEAVAKLAPGNAGGLTTKPILPAVSGIDADTFFFPYLKKSLLTTVSGQIYTLTGVQSAELSFGSPFTHRRSEIANNLHVSGGILWMYDGDAVVEHGFHLFPENITNAPDNPGGNIAAGTRQYVVVYEWTDNQGQTHKSAPSVPLSVTNSVSNSFNTLTIPTLRVTAKQDIRSPISVVVYRTVAAGQIFYRVTPVTNPTYNDATVDTITVVDELADSSILGNPILYTTGGVLENICAPAVALVTAYRNRLVVVPAENRNSYWYSKNIIDGSPAEFTDAFVASVPQRGGEITAVAEMDDKLILFKRDTIEFTSWLGPLDTGAENDVQDPVIITTDGGCINPRSVVITPQGLMYQSAKGFYILTRSLEVSYIGAAVEAFNNETVTGAVLASDTNTVKFALASGIFLVYDYLVGQWSTFTNKAATDLVNYDGRYVLCNSLGQVFMEDRTGFTDAGEHVPLLVETSWISLAGVQGFIRAYKFLILGEYKSPHTLKVSIAYDFNDAWVQVVNIDPQTELNPLLFGGDSFFGESTPFGGTGNVYQWEISFERQKIQSFKVKIEDVPNDNPGESFELSAMTILAGVKLNTMRLARGRRF